ncbi:zinc ABC transporter substrate-binding protein [Gemmata sp. JC673]|uniref:Zinc ABC transporter substrate-binding protein n=1 Tax=Gemmata algarum TaxID=2975278 RepID=A0ABU5EU12_9BACT|nr:zinc ABC transporter substrate-binding protein [Gemmata algarum]MDY3558798.1 zinc ABC transporter substrate-binding protein [Gemmata algarum]
MRVVQIALIAVAGGFTVLGLPGCSGGPPAFEKPPVRVVVTTTMIADLVKKVGGDRVSVDALMGPGVDPHRYQPTAGDRKKIDAAHVVFFNGLHLEGKMTDTFEKSRGRVRAHAVTAAIDKAQLRHAEVDGGEHDPHVWFDVALWAKTVDVVRDALVALDPAGAGDYERNAAGHRRELESLDTEVRQALAVVPKDKRVLVTSHDAFGYFGRAYGFEVRGLQGVSTASESGTKDVKELVDFLGRNKIPAVFTETSVPDAGLKTVLDACRRDHNHTVSLVGGEEALYSDALGEPGTRGETYTGMVRHNVAVIVRALGR